MCTGQPVHNMARRKRAAPRKKNKGSVVGNVAKEKKKDTRNNATGEKKKKDDVQTKNTGEKSAGKKVDLKEESEDESAPDFPDLLSIRERTKKGILMYSKNRLDFFVKRINFEKQNRFNIDDHLFLAKVYPGRTRNDPLLNDTLNVLKEGLASIIIHLQSLEQHYDPLHHHQIYIKFDDKHFTRGALHTGNYALYFHETHRDVELDRQHATRIAGDALNFTRHLVEKQ